MIKKWCVGMLLAASFWGIAFPQYLFTGDCVRIFDENGREATGEKRADRNLYREIGTAEPEQIEIRISFLDRAER